MLNGLSRWGRRIWLACCSLFQFRHLRALRPGATTHALGQRGSRYFPRSRVEAMRQGILVPPEGESLFDDLAIDEVEPETKLDLEEALMLPGEDSGEHIADAPLLESGALETPEPHRSPAIANIDRNVKLRNQPTGAELPFDWVLKERLAIGIFPRKGWEQNFEEQGICVIISLCHESEGTLPEAIAEQCRCLRVPLPNSHYRRALTFDELGDAVDLIHWHVQKQKPVYLHSLAGIERSPMVAIAYLARYCSMSFGDAVIWLTHVQSRSHPIPDQLQVVQEYLQSC